METQNIQQQHKIGSLALETLKKEINDVYFLGIGSTKEVIVTMPRGIDYTKSYIQDQSLVLNIYNTDFVATTNATVRGLWPNSDGTIVFTLTSHGDFVSISSDLLSFDPVTINPTVNQGSSLQINLKATNIATTTKNYSLRISFSHTLATLTSTSQDTTIEFTDGEQETIPFIASCASSATGSYSGTVTFEGDVNVSLPATITCGKGQSNLVINPSSKNISLAVSESGTSTFLVCNNTRTNFASSSSSTSSTINSYAFTNFSGAIPASSCKQLSLDINASDTNGNYIGTLNVFAGGLTATADINLLFTATETSDENLCTYSYPTFFSITNSDLNHFFDYNGFVRQISSSASITNANSWTATGELDWNQNSREIGEMDSTNYLFDSNLVVLWHLNESSGDAIDSSGNGYDGTVTSATQGITGLWNTNSYTFDGLNDYVNFGNIEEIGGSTELTLSVWVYTDGLSDPNSGVIIGGYEVTDSNRGFLLRVSTSNVLDFLIYNQSNNSYWERVKTNSAIPLNRWALITGTWDADESFHIYIDGEEVATTYTSNGTVPTQIPDKVSPVTIGGAYHASTTPDYLYDGIIEEVGIWNRVLSSAEVFDLYESKKQDWLDENLVAYYKFNDTNGDIGIYDSARGYDGTLVGTANISAKGMWDSNALSLDGDSDYVALGDVGNIRSISYWVKADSSDNTLMSLNNTDYILNSGFVQNTQGINATTYVNGTVVSFLGNHLMGNTDFENWSGGDATSWIDNKGDSAQESSEVYYGSYSNKFTKDTSATWGQGYQDISITANKKYYISSWIKNANATELRIFCQDTGDWGTSGYITSNSTAWTEIQSVCYTDSSNPYRVSIQVYASDSSAKYGYFDLYQFREILEPIPSDEWVHVAIILSEDISASDLNIGRWKTKYFEGEIDEVKIYDRALTADEVEADYNSFLEAKFVSSPDSIVDSNNVSADWNSIKVNNDVNYSFGKEICGNVDTCNTDQFNNGLVGLWHLNAEDDVTDFEDSSGNGYDGSSQNFDNDENVSCLWGTNCYDFDGSNDYIETGYDDDFALNQSMTIMAWIKPASYAVGGYNGIVSTVPEKGTYDPIVELMLGDGQCDPLEIEVQVRASNNSTTYNLCSLNTVPLSEWSQVIYLYNGDNDDLNIYINGVRDTGRTVGDITQLNMSGYPFAIGARNVRGVIQNYFDGAIEEVVVWERALSSEEILDLYRKGVSRLDLNVYSCSDENCNTKTSEYYISGINNNTDYSISSLSSSQYLGYDILFKQNTDFSDRNAGFFNVGAFLRDVNATYSVTGVCPEEPEIPAISPLVTIVGLTTDQYLTASTLTKVAFDYVRKDSMDAFDTENNEFVVPTTGKYEIFLQATVNNLTTNKNWDVRLYKYDGSTETMIARGYTYLDAGSYRAEFASNIYDLNAGDTVYVKVQTTDSSRYVLGLSNWTYMSIRQLSEGTFVGASAYATSTLSIPASTWTQCAFDTESFDPQGDFDLDNNWYVVPEEGYYITNAGIQLQDLPDGKRQYIALYKSTDGVETGLAFKENSLGGTTWPTQTVVDLSYFSAEDKILSKVYHNNTSALNLSTGSATVFLSVRKVLESPVVAARVHMSADQSIKFATNTTIPFDVVDFDTHDAWDTTDYSYTAPVDGNYLIYVVQRYLNISVNKWIQSRIDKNVDGVNVETRNQRIVVGGATLHPSSATYGRFELNAGDKIGFVTQQYDSTTDTLYSPASGTHAFIIREGN